MVQSRDKNIYRLWWEYLKRSERFKKYLEWERDFKSQKKTPLPADLGPYHQPLWNMTRTFGDVDSQSFNEWWEGEVENGLPSPLFPYYSEPGKHIADGRNVVGKEVDRVYCKFRKEFGREPKLEELIHGLKEHMALMSDKRLYIVVEFLHASTEEIIQEFREVLSQRKKESRSRQAAFESKGAEGKPTSIGPKCDELQRYLKVYDQWKKGLMMDKIIEKVGTRAHRKLFSDLKKGGVVPTSSTGDPDDIRRAYRRDLQKAKKIIHNVERGYFPGSY